MCAIMVAKELNIKNEVIVDTIKNFSGVEHRLELILETENRVKWYNDSVSSSPTRTMAGLNAFALRNIILIAGGYDKHLDYTVMAKPIIDNCKGLVLLGQTADKIDKAVTDELKKQNKTMPIARCTSLEEAITEADKLSQKGDIVLFSPASASFDMFKNFAERGELFKENVKKMIK